MHNLDKHYWENRYQNNQTSWDVGEISTPMQLYIDQLTDKNLKILIPGAGNGYEFDYLINKGFKNVYVVDIAIQPIENLKEKHPLFSKNIIQNDFFELFDTFDLILEQTFFCALSPNLRPSYVEKMASLLNRNGKLVGLFFNFPLTESGPPYGGSKLEYQNLFSSYFTIKSLEQSYNSIKPRKNRELFFIFEKK